MTLSTRNWTSRAVPVFTGQHDTHIETGEDYRARTLAEIFAKQPGSQPKNLGPAFIPSLYVNYDARCHAVQREHGEFVALTGDIDTGDHSLSLIERLVRAFVGQCAWLIYSSAHARPGDMRWRIVIPLAEPASFPVWHDAQCAFFTFMERAGVDMDRALSRAGQLVYLPNVPTAHGKTEEALRGADGRALYFQRASTGIDAPGLRLDRGSIAVGLADIQSKRDSDNRERERLRAAAERRRALQADDDEGSLIVRFNRSNALADLLAGYGYEQSPRNADDWRSPNQTSESYATRIMGDKWVSLSMSDASARLGGQCASGCYGDAYDLFVHFGHGGNHQAAFRQLRQEHKDALAYAKFGRPASMEGPL